MIFSCTDIEGQKLDSLIAALQQDEFGTYLTSVGGSGLGILSPYNPESHSGFIEGGPVTPPETPHEQEHGGDEELSGRRSLRAAFETKSGEDLAEWVERRGRWLFV